MQLVQATMSGYSFFIALFMDQDGVEVAKTRLKKERGQYPASRPNKVGQ